MGWFYILKKDERFNLANSVCVKEFISIFSSRNVAKGDEIDVAIMKAVATLATNEQGEQLKHIENGWRLLGEKIAILIKGDKVSTETYLKNIKAEMGNISEKIIII